MYLDTFIISDLYTIWILLFHHSSTSTWLCPAFQRVHVFCPEGCSYRSSKFQHFCWIDFLTEYLLLFLFVVRKTPFISLLLAAFWFYSQVITGCLRLMWPIAGFVMNYNKLSPFRFDYRPHNITLYHLSAPRMWPLLHLLAANECFMFSCWPSTKNASFCAFMQPRSQ